MLIKTSTIDFKQSVMEILQGTSKICINFFIKDNTLFLQTTAGAVIERLINIKSIEDYMSIDITIIVDRTLELLNEKEEITEIRVNEDVLTIRQNGFMFSATKQPELRVRLDDCPAEEFTKFDNEEFKAITNDARMLDDLAKTLGTEVAPINIVKETVYVIYSNTVYIQSCRLPDMKITSQTARKVASTLLSNMNTQYYFNQERGNLELKIGDKKRIVMSTLNPDYRVIKAIQDKEQRLKFVNRINVKRYKHILDTICRVYKKLLIDISICKSDLRIFANNINTQLDLGSKEIPDMTIRVSIAQLVAVTKLFGELTDVEILKGENMICLKHPYTKRSLIIAGMLF